MRNWTLGLLVSLLALPAYGQVTIEGMTLADVSVVATVPGGPTCSGTTSESFDTTAGGGGYDLQGSPSWTENLLADGVVDEDNTTRTETYFSSEDLRVGATGGSSEFRAYLGAVTTDPMYAAISFYLDSESLSDTEWATVFQISDDSNQSACVLLHDDTGTLTLELHYANNCASTTSDTYTISLDTVYIIEMYADNDGASTDTVGWRVFDCGASGDSCTTTPDHTYEDTALEASTGSNDRILLGSVEHSNYYDSYVGFLEIKSSQVCN